LSGGNLNYEGYVVLKVLAMDFDGVLVDSAMEGFFISHNTYFKMFGEKKGELCGGRFITFDNWDYIKVKCKNKIDYFMTLRPFVRIAEDYGLICDLMRESKKIKKQEEFDVYRNKNIAKYREYSNEIYKERDRIKNIDFNKWLNLYSVYTDMIKGIKDLITNKNRLFITTLNRKETVLSCLNNASVDYKFQEEYILDVSFGEEKSKQMRYIVDNFPVRFEDIYFIDDLVNNLIEAKALGVNVILAGWGYSTSEQKRIALKSGIPIIEKPDDFYHFLKILK